MANSFHRFKWFIEKDVSLLEGRSSITLVLIVKTIDIRINIILLAQHYHRDESGYTSLYEHH